MLRRVGLSFAILFGLATVAMATPTIVVPNVALLPNTPNQVILITVTGSPSDQVGGVNFIIDVAQGKGNGVATSGLNATQTSGPKITAVDITGAGTVFGPNNTGVQNLMAPQTLPWEKAAFGTSTTAGTVTANGLLARVTIDTTGFSQITNANGGVGGVWQLRMKSMTVQDGGGATDFAGVPATITNGSITLVSVPEPASVVLGLFAAAGLGAVALRNRRARRTA